MAVFTKKTTIVHHMTYMAIMAAINLVFIIFATFLPISILILIIILPLVSTVVAYFCQKKYYIIYAIATIGLCLIFNVVDTIFYIVPAVITGFFIGVMLEYKINPFWMILVSTAIQTGLTYLFIPLINVISGTDFVLSILTFLKLETFVYRGAVTHLFIFFISFTQTILTTLVLLNEIGKIGIKTEQQVASVIPYISGLLFSLILAIVFALFRSDYTFVFIAISFYFASFLLMDLFSSKKPMVYGLLVTTTIVSFFVFVFLYGMIVPPFGFVLFGLFSFSIGLISFLNKYLLK
jgi:hypothetical protein